MLVEALVALRERFKPVQTRVGVTERERAGLLALASSLFSLCNLPASRAFSFSASVTSLRNAGPKAAWSASKSDSEVVFAGDTDGKCGSLAVEEAGEEQERLVGRVSPRGERERDPGLGSLMLLIALR